jgi:hypothetical protein
MEQLKTIGLIDEGDPINPKKVSQYTMEQWSVPSGYSWIPDPASREIEYTWYPQVCGDPMDLTL